MPFYQCDVAYGRGDGVGGRGRAGWEEGGREGLVGGGRMCAVEARLQWGSELWDRYDGVVGHVTR